MRQTGVTKTVAAGVQKPDDRITMFYVTLAIIIGAMAYVVIMTGVTTAQADTHDAGLFTTASWLCAAAFITAFRWRLAWNFEDERKKAAGKGGKKAVKSKAGTFAVWFVVGLVGVAAADSGGSYINYLTLNLTGVEVFFYYITQAVAEECFFRILIVTLVCFIGFKIFPRHASVVNLAACIASMLAFAWTHEDVYGAHPVLIVTVAACGFILALVLVETRNPLACILIHALVNGISKWSLLFT